MALAQRIVNRLAVVLVLIALVSDAACADEEIVIVDASKYASTADVQKAFPPAHPGTPRTLPGLDCFHLAGQWVVPGGGLPTAAIEGRRVIQMLCAEDGKAYTARED